MSKDIPFEAKRETLTSPRRGEVGARSAPGEGGEPLAMSDLSAPSSGASRHLLPDGEKEENVRTTRARNLRRTEAEAEAKLWSRLRDRRLDGWKFKRQVAKGKYFVDFCCADARLVVELDGSQHAEDIAVRHDADRTRFLNESGYRVVRFWNGEIFTNLDGVLQTIWAKLQEPPLPDFKPHSVYPEGRGL